jgi:hypothetical protein
MKIQKIQKKIVFFSIILPEILPDPFSPGWSHRPGLKGPPAFCGQPGLRGWPLIPVHKQPGLNGEGL